MPFSDCSSPPPSLHPFWILSEFFAISLIYRREHTIISLKMKLKNNLIFLLSYGKKTREKSFEIKSVIHGCRIIARNMQLLKWNIFCLRPEREEQKKKRVKNVIFNMDCASVASTSIRLSLLLVLEPPMQPNMIGCPHSNERKIKNFVFCLHTT